MMAFAITVDQEWLGNFAMFKDLMDSSISKETNSSQRGILGQVELPNNCRKVRAALSGIGNGEESSLRTLFTLVAMMIFIVTG